MASRIYTAIAGSLLQSHPEDSKYQLRMFKGEKIVWSTPEFTYEKDVKNPA